MQNALGELTLHNVAGIIGRAVALEDKALLIEREIGLESIYTLIANGEKLGAIASPLRVTIQDLKFMLTRTTELRQKYLAAKTFNRANVSGETLDGETFSKAHYLEKESNNAVKHHAAMVKQALDVLNQGKEEKGSSITVENTIVVRSVNDIPELPPGVGELIEGEYKDVDLNDDSGE